jgi:hypothetical protein
VGYPQYPQTATKTHPAGPNWLLLGRASICRLNHGLLVCSATYVRFRAFLGPFEGGFAQSSVMVRLDDFLNSLWPLDGTV